MGKIRKTNGFLLNIDRGEISFWLWRSDSIQLTETLNTEKKEDIDPIHRIAQLNHIVKYENKLKIKI